MALYIILKASINKEIIGVLRYNLTMNSLAKLDQLNLDAATKNQVAALMQALIDQVDRDAALLQSKEATINSQAALIHTKELKISALTHEIAYYKRIRYSFKSEAFSAVQRDIFQESWNTDMSAIEAELEQLQTKSDTTENKTKQSRIGRQPLPAHLPRVEMRHEPEQCVCGQCGNKQLVKIGEDVSEQLHIEPAVFSVIRHIRRKRPINSVCIAKSKRVKIVSTY